MITRGSSKWGFVFFFNVYPLVSFPCQAGAQFYQGQNLLEFATLGEEILVSVVKVFFLGSSKLPKKNVRPKDIAMGTQHGKEEFASFYCRPQV